MLAIFDQSLIVGDDHILVINESDYPEKFKPIIRRLNMATASNEIRQQMEAEDEIIEELQGLERVIEEQNEFIAEKDNTIAEKDNTIAEKDNTIAEQQKLIEKLMQELKH